MTYALVGAMSRKFAFSIGRKAAVRFVGTMVSISAFDVFARGTCLAGRLSGIDRQHDHLVRRDRLMAELAIV